MGSHKWCRDSSGDGESAGRKVTVAGGTGAERADWSRQCSSLSGVGRGKKDKINCLRAVSISLFVNGPHRRKMATGKYLSATPGPAPSLAPRWALRWPAERQQVADLILAQGCRQLRTRFQDNPGRGPLWGGASPATPTRIQIRRRFNSNPILIHDNRKRPGEVRRRLSDDKPAGRLGGPRRAPRRLWSESALAKLAGDNWPEPSGPRRKSRRRWAPHDDGRR